MASNAPRRINTKTTPNVSLIWVDSNIDGNNRECQNTITQLRRVMNTVTTFSNGEECVKFLKGLKDNKVCMIISGSLGKDFVPFVHDMSQVDSIFIFCGNKQYHEQWAKDWQKIKGVFTDIKLICDALKQSAKECEQNAIGFTVVPTNTGDASKVNLNQLDPMFIYMQVIKEILSVLKYEDKHILEFTRYCRGIFGTTNKHKLDEVNRFEQDYRKQAPLWWYTLQSFLCPMLNQALRLSDIDVIIKMGFFIGDLHRQIEEFHQKQFSGPKSKKKFTVYRGQEMSNEQFETVLKAKGGLMAFNNFLSTSTEENVSKDFVLSNPAMMGVLFSIKIDLHQSTTPFASVADACDYKDKENEILFSMHTVFRIRDIKQMDVTKRLFRVELELTSDNDEELQVLTIRVREETFPNSEGWNRLGLTLMKFGKPEQAEEVYQIILQQSTDEMKNGELYNQLGLCKEEQAKYEEAIQFYQISIDIDKKYTSNQLHLATVYSNIGSAYSRMENYAKALSSYEKALAIRQQSLPPNHPDLGASYNNIGLVYTNMKDYTKAYSFYEKAVKIAGQSLPANHPLLRNYKINLEKV